MKKFMLAIKHSQGYRSVALVPVIFKCRNLKKYIKENPILENDMSLKIMIGNGGTDFISSTFENIEFTMLRLHYNGLTHLLNSSDYENFELDYLLYADLTTDKFELEVYKVAK